VPRPGASRVGPLQAGRDPTERADAEAGGQPGAAASRRSFTHGSCGGCRARRRAAAAARGAGAHGGATIIRKSTAAARAGGDGQGLGRAAGSKGRRARQEAGRGLNPKPMSVHPSVIGKLQRQWKYQIVWLAGHASGTACAAITNPTRGSTTDTTSRMKAEAPPTPEPTARSQRPASTCPGRGPAAGSACGEAGRGGRGGQAFLRPQSAVSVRKCGSAARPLQVPFSLAAAAQPGAESKARSQAQRARV
jgi:hypothetical protein